MVNEQAWKALHEELAAKGVTLVAVSKTKPVEDIQALYTIAWSIGQIVGPYLGSITAQHLGFTMLWWIVGGISLATAIGYKTLDAVLKRN